MKCAVKDCKNHTYEGKFVGLLCLPCHTFITGNNGLYSQAYRNTRHMIDMAIAIEREECAKICDNYPWGVGLTEKQLAQAIRARSEK